jgi:hypothetical protein
MIALRRAEVAELNARARARLDAAGRLGRARLALAGGEFAVATTWWSSATIAASGCTKRPRPRHRRRPRGWRVDAGAA